jgi:putative ABC transport system permease protein
VVLTGGAHDPAPGDTGAVKVAVERYANDAAQGDAGPARSTATVPGIVMHLGSTPPVLGILSAPAAAKVGLEAADVGLVIDGASISEAQEKDAQEALDALPVGGFLYVERGYQPDSATWIVQLVLTFLALILMLGGTLTATFLSLSDARPDLATLSAVGAAPRTRRGVAAAYALVIGGIGAVLGALVGFVPGIAVTYPLTSQGWNTCLDCGQAPEHFLAVPWLLIGGLVLVLPMLVAGLVWVFVRSRLPLVSRLS